MKSLLLAMMVCLVLGQNLQGSSNNSISDDPSDPYFDEVIDGDLSATGSSQDEDDDPVSAILDDVAVGGSAGNKTEERK